MISGLLGLAGAIAVAVFAAWKTRKNRMVRVDPRVQEETLRRAFKVVFDDAKFDHPWEESARGAG